MVGKDRVVGFGAGLLVGLFIAVLFLSGRAAPHAAAQSLVGTAPHYKIAAYPGTPGSGPLYGAYVIDVQNGRVWHIWESMAPRAIGQVK